MSRTSFVPLAATVLALAVLAGPGPVASSGELDNACCQDSQTAAAGSVVNVQNLPYGTDPAQKLDVYRPSTANASTSYPSIIIVHGGGWSMFDQAGNRCLATYFVQRGNYVVFNIDYRKLDNSTVYLNDIIEDVFGAILWVKDNAAKYGGNPDMIGITGDSAGGHLAAIAALAADRVSATGGFAAGRFTFKPVYLGTRTKVSPSDVAVNACASNFGVMTIPTDMTLVSLRDYKTRLNMLAAPVNTPEHYAACSPMSNIANKGVPKIPFLDAGGSADTVVPPATIDAFHSALVSAGYPATRINYPGLGHAYLNCGRSGIGADAAKAADDMLAFWNRHLVKAATASGQPAGAPYLDPALSSEKRAADLVSRMTLEERVLQMQNSAPAIPRLGVPVYNWWNEALHGVAQRRATVFPEPIGLGASFDPELVRKMADAISTEARAKYHEAMRQPPVTEVAPGAAPGRIAYLDYWSPNINIFRDPRWGRGQETYGEDPFLTSRMGVAFVRGMQGDDPRYLKTIATPKHFAVHSGPEPLRHSFDAKVSEYDLVNTYLYAFKATVIEGKAGSIMCVYNAVDGVPGCASTDLLQTRLRGQWGFQGYVVSDCGAIGDIFRSHKYAATQGAASVAAVKAGTDLTCGGEYKSLLDEVKAGTITEAEITRAAERLFEARIRLGMFDPPERVPYTKIPYSVNDSAAHRQLARQAEREAIVLLKNAGGILPLKPTIARIAVIGPSADDPVGLLGNYNGISSKQVTPLEGIARQFAQAKVQYALGANYTSTTPALVAPNVLSTPDGSGPGLLAEYWDNPDFQGQPTLRRTEPRVYFDSFMEEPAVMTAINGEKYAIRWTGSLTPPATGDYVLSARTGQWNRNGRIRLFIDDKEVNPSGPAGARPAGLGPGQGQGQGPGPGGRRLPAPVPLEGGRKYAVRVEFQQTGPEGSAEFNWIPPAAVLLAEAEKVAKDSDVVILCVGLNGSQEGEGRDRTAIELPDTEENLVKSMIASGKPVVVVLTSGSALAVNYAAEHAAAILSAWYGGEEAGSAIADTLAGMNNPAGRLPVTFYKSTSQLPAFTDYNMKGHTYRYFRGEPLYPFGFGLSYSTFQYSGLTARRTRTGAEIRVTVKNTSAVEGDEVVQVYVDGGPGDDAPIRNLRGFERVHLRAGESRQVTFTVASGDLPKEKVAISVGGGQPLAGVPHLKTGL